MKILIDIGHPAHVHLYRNFYNEMTERGHSLYVTVKNLPSATRLLYLYGIPYTLIGSKGDTLASKGVRQVFFSLRLAAMASRLGIDVGGEEHGR